MPSLDSLYTVVHSRFHDAFGKPHAVEGGGEQWTLFPAQTSKLGIHVLLNGSPWSPGVWVFDPHDAAGTGVENTLISDNNQIDDLVQRIWQRLDRIGAPR
jgi:hypothetical protein